MPRYFFNVHDGISTSDLIGSEHPDLYAVREEAVETIAERLKGKLLKSKDLSSWTLNVTNDSGLTVLILSLSAAVQIIQPD
jgi:hypothetical protein